MATLKLEALTKKFEDMTAVDHMNLEVADGEMIALLGGSGCGKTTTLRMIAGFTTPTEGDIWIDGERVNELPSYKRNVGIFFQNYALFPHLTTFDNIAFGLKLKKLPKDVVKEKVRKILSLVQLEGMEKRFPKELSGGQQQRVALARALVMEPAVLLLDEPLSNLDAKLRVEMQVEIKRIQKEVGITTIIVTHDQEEAVSLADRVIVMNAGRILQVGSPKEVFDCPVSPFVADFMGFGNIFSGRLARFRDGRGEILCGQETLYAPEASCKGIEEGEEVTLAIRPENLILAEAPGRNVLGGRIRNVTYKGHMTRLEVKDCLAEQDLYLSVHDYEGEGAGTPVRVCLPEEKLLVYPREQWS
ncbi:MAG: ABC transporter ATP-binding protein [Lachnospiraceae bacterium]|nr:ABC transporter ATP-binding protein [Lachnospiraceae bacterium]